MKQPHHNLEIVRARAEAAVSDRVVFNPDGSTDIVVAILDLSITEAADFILANIASLTLDCFSETLRNRPPPADVYGYRDRSNRAWYVKVALSEPGRLVVISFHPPERTMSTNGGAVTR